MNFELAAPRPRLPAKKAAPAKRTVGRRPSLASRREEKKLARAAVSTWNNIVKIVNIVNRAVMIIVKIIVKIIIKIIVKIVFQIVFLDCYDDFC